MLVALVWFEKATKIGYRRVGGSTNRFDVYSSAWMCGEKSRIPIWTGAKDSADKLRP
jgi:hypothetical protein